MVSKTNKTDNMPDPETKEDHMQKPTVLGLIFPKIQDLEYGVMVAHAVKKDQLEIITK